VYFLFHIGNGHPDVIRHVEFSSNTIKTDELAVHFVEDAGSHSGFDLYHPPVQEDGTLPLIYFKDNEEPFERLLYYCSFNYVNDRWTRTNRVLIGSFGNGKFNFVNFI
jgi:hypothetical protein